MLREKDVLKQQRIGERLTRAMAKARIDRKGARWADGLR
jgi:hypothetical protein